MRLFIPGAIVNPGQSGWTWQKRARLAKSIRERVAMHVLREWGRRPPWPLATPKRVMIRGYVHTRFDDDRFPAAVAPYRDGLMDCGMFSPRGVPGQGDAPKHGHIFVYEQKVERGKGATRGVEIVVSVL